MSLLDRTLASLPEQVAAVIIVGAVREVSRSVVFTSEAPPGGGPAAALVAGLRRALDESSDAIVTLPGDAPLAGQAAGILLSRLDSEPNIEAVVGIDSAGHEQPLQLALRRAAAESVGGSRRTERRSRGIRTQAARCTTAWFGCSRAAAR